VHLLLADDPDEFAAAAVRLIEDSALRTRIAGEAEKLYLKLYDGRAAEEGIRRLLEDLSGLRTLS
jgi:hypothetical protein